MPYCYCTQFLTVSERIQDGTKPCRRAKITRDKNNPVYGTPSHPSDPHMFYLMSCLHIIREDILIKLHLMLQQMFICLEKVETPHYFWSCLNIGTIVSEKKQGTNHRY